MKSWLRHNSLSVTVLSIFLVLLVGQCGHFGEATSEKGESEFRQMAASVLLTAFLRQRGSAESKSFSDDEAVDRDPRRDRDKPDAPYPIRRGGWLLTLYEWSLSVAFFIMFLVALLGIWRAAYGSRTISERWMVLLRLHGPTSCRRRSSGSRPCRIGKAKFSLSVL
jgi:hypothetical protein